LAFFLSLCFSARSQVDSTALAAMDKMIANYVAAIDREPVGVKIQECDFMISECKDSVLRQFTALKLYSHYLNSQLMGDEAVAIHVYDRWFVTREVDMGSEINLLNAGIFADFNRSSLIGMHSPEIMLESIDGDMMQLPSKDRYSLLFFYDASCSKCQLESSLLKPVLDSGRYDVDFFAVFCGDDRASWMAYVKERLDICSESVRTYHLWDPQMISDFKRLYGVLQTPRMFLVAPDGRIVGRMLNTEAFIKLMIHYGK